MTIRLRRKKIIIVGIVVAVILVAGAVVFIYREQLFHLSTTSSDAKSAASKSGNATKLSETQTKVVNQGDIAARNLYSDGDVSGALEVYDEYIKQSSGDSQVVASLTFSKGLLLLNAGQYEEALAVGVSLEESAPSEESAMLIGEASAKLDNIDKAVTYYKLAIERHKKNIVLPPSDAAAEASAAKKAGGDYTPSEPTDNTQRGYEMRLKELQK